VLLLRRSILTEKVARKGHHVMREYIVDPFETTRIADIMAEPVDTLSGDMLVNDVVEFFTAPDSPPRHKSYPVLDEKGALIGMVARADVLRWTMSGWAAGTPLRDALGEQELVTGYEDDLVGALADQMAVADVGRVPILRRSDEKLVGLVARRDLLRVRADVVRHEREREVLLRVRLQPRRSTS
jgi:CBS domain-containing protein